MGPAWLIFVVCPRRWSDALVSTYCAVQRPSSLRDTRARRTNACQTRRSLERLLRANRDVFFGVVRLTGTFCRFLLCRENHRAGINVGEEDKYMSGLSFSWEIREPGENWNKRWERNEHEKFQYTFVKSRARRHTSNLHILCYFQTHFYNSNFLSCFKLLKEIMIRYQTESRKIGQFYNLQKCVLVSTL